MKIQYDFNYLLPNILKLLATMRIYIYLNIISFNCARKLHLRDIEMTDRSRYYFFNRSTEYAI